jgi:hypothetical protein
MAEYQVNFTDSVNKGSIIVDDGTTNSTDTSLVFPGRNFANYGKIVNENFLHLLENFANNTAPVNPIEFTMVLNGLVPAALKKQTPNPKHLVVF